MLSTDCMFRTRNNDETADIYKYLVASLSGISSRDLSFLSELFRRAESHSKRIYVKKYTPLTGGSRLTLIPHNLSN